MSKDNLQGIYSWLKTATVPKMVDEALRFYGVKDNYTDASNPTITLWRSRLGFDLRSYYECTTDHHYDLSDLGGLSGNHSMNDSKHLFGNNLRVVTEGHFVPWCGLFMGFVAKEAGKKSVKEPCWPLNWGNFGVEADDPMLGDVLIFIRLAETRKKAGHLGLYIGEDKDCYHVLGGNEDNKVCITRILKSRLYTARRPKYRETPNCVRKIALPSNCALTQKFALCM